jgi:hypothetical protein
LKKCPNCNRDLEDSVLICTFCGALLVNDTEYNATRSLGDTDFEEGIPKWGTARFSSRMNLVINLRESNGSFVFDADQITELVIGRRDVDSGVAPALDLHPFSAAEKGVSRRHASIIRRDGALNIVDKGSPNGTFLNGQRLIPNQPRILRDGDDIRLGHLVLHVQFERA